jgi:putative flippase GtrA
MKKLKHFWQKRAFVRYGFVGGASFIVEYSSFLLLYGSIGIDYRIANIGSMLLSLSFNFILNRRMVFGIKGAFLSKKTSVHLTKYLALAVFNILMSTLVIGALVHWGVKEYVAKLIAIMLVVSWTFIIYKTIIFKEKKTKGGVL